MLTRRQPRDWNRRQQDGPRAWMFHESQACRTGTKTRRSPDEITRKYYHAAGVYILVAVNGLCKIGQTESLYKRVASLWTMIPDESEVYAFFPTQSRTFAEEILRQLVRNLRVKSEWFALSENDLARVIGFYPFNLINEKAGEFLETYSAA
jgi:hypothetical protein